MVEFGKILGIGKGEGIPGGGEAIEERSTDKLTELAIGEGGEENSWA